MKLPFFNLKAKNVDVKSLNLVRLNIENLIKLSKTNDKEVEIIILSESAFESIANYSVIRKGKRIIFGKEVKIYPDVAIVWKK